MGSYKVHIYSKSVPYCNHQSAQLQFGEVESRPSSDAQLCTAANGVKRKSEINHLYYNYIRYLPRFHLVIILDFSYSMMKYYASCKLQEQKQNLINVKILLARSGGSSEPRCPNDICFLPWCMVLDYPHLTGNY